MAFQNILHISQFQLTKIFKVSHPKLAQVILSIVEGHIVFHILISTASSFSSFFSFETLHFLDHSYMDFLL